MNGTQPTHDHLTPRQIATSAQVSVGTVYNWIRSGDLTAFEVSRSRNASRRQYRIPRLEWDRFRRSRETSPAPKAPPKDRRIDEGMIQYV